MNWDKQVGGDHYRKVPGEQHWTRVYRLFGPGYFVGCITKYVERYQVKNGKEDLEKALHFLNKLIELEYPRSAEPVEEEMPPHNDFSAYEANSPQYLHSKDFLCEGGCGGGTNLYRCRNCRKLLWAIGLQEAAATHGRECHIPKSGML